jgi:hypothetical protein
VVEAANRAKDATWWPNFFESDPSFDLKGYYESRVKIAYYEALKNYFAVSKEFDELLEHTRVNGTNEEYWDLLENRNITFEPIDLSFASQFLRGETNASYETVLEHNNESFTVLISIQRVHEKYRNADRVEFLIEPPFGNSALGRGSKTNFYQHRLGEKGTVRVIFGYKNRGLYGTIGRQ